MSSSTPTVPEHDFHTPHDWIRFYTHDVNFLYEKHLEELKTLCAEKGNKHTVLLCMQGYTRGEYITHESSLTPVGDKFVDGSMPALVRAKLRLLQGDQFMIMLRTLADNKTTVRFRITRLKDIQLTPTTPATISKQST